jgi:hypothetical protein
VLEGCNILDVIEVGKIVGSMNSSYPADTALPRFSATGTHFDDFRVAGRRLWISLRQDLYFKPQSYPSDAERGTFIIGGTRNQMHVGSTLREDAERRRPRWEKISLRVAKREFAKRFERGTEFYR